MKEIPTNKPLPLEATSTSPPNAELEQTLKFIDDVATFDDHKYLRQQTDALLEGMAKEKPELLADVLLDLACRDSYKLHDLASSNVGFLYGANPELGRTTWELLVTNEHTHSEARSLLYEHMSQCESRALTSREIEDYAAIERRAEEYEQSKSQQQD